MSTGEKTEAPTPKRREDARKRGNIPRSVEINSVMALLAGALAMKHFGSGMLSQILNIMERSFLSLSIEDWTVPGVTYYGSALVMAFLQVMLPLMAVLSVVGLTSNFVQVGGLLTFKPLAPDFARINPLKGFQRIFSKRSIVELVKSLAKFGIVGYVTYQSFEGRYLQIVTQSGTDVKGAAVIVGDALIEIVLRAGFALLALAVLDYGYQRWSFERSIRMNRQEIKEELRQSEGDPQIRARLRQQRKQLQSRRMMAAVPKADVVVTNPTHYAIAIAYRPESMRSPQVTAKGQNLVAERIKQIATENGVPIMENKPLAQALFTAVEIGQEIPPALYQAVAEVLAFIYSLKRNRRLS